MMKNNKQVERNKVPSIWQRIHASLIDYFVILAWMAVLFLIWLLLFLLLGSHPDYLGIFGPVGTQIIFFFVLTLPVGLYLYVSESGARHATVGKRKVGLRVVGTDKQVPSKKSILLRTIIKLLPWEIAHTFIWQMQYVFYQFGYEADVPMWIFAGLSLSMLLVIFYVAMAVFSKDGRAPHDFVAGTRVVFR